MDRDHRPAPRALRTLVSGCILAVIGFVVMFGFRVEACADGPVSGTCTSGPASGAIVIGLVIVGVGVAVVMAGVRRHK